MQTTVTLSLVPGGSVSLWHGDVTLPSFPQPGTQRLVVEEYEVLSASANDDSESVTTRVVFTDIIDL